MYHVSITLHRKRENKLLKNITSIFIKAFFTEIKNIIYKKSNIIK